ncbi:peroxiredoxin [Mycoplasma mycoides]|uniref:peroxiredoxin n=1 Tax=Mycoplasma mycoides TaxID=2102 RepID=UPI00223F6496|nr:peroxiredoxin [Mycoplasma mycoides]QVK06888.1 peroxiredoxin [Mycoplasma mycoides subsp. capri]
MKNYQLKDHKNNLVELNSLVGQKGLIIFFYPKAKTSLCTLEVIEYQKHLDEFKQLGFNVIGVSQDEPNKNDEFCCEQNLSFLLLSDLNKDLVNEFNLTSETIVLDDEPFVKYERSTFVLDNQLNLLKEFRNVDHIEHVSDLLEYLKKND